MLRICLYIHWGTIIEYWYWKKAKWQLPISTTAKWCFLLTIQTICYATENIVSIFNMFSLAIISIEMSYMPRVELFVGYYLEMVESRETKRSNNSKWIYKQDQCPFLCRFRCTLINLKTMRAGCSVLLCNYSTSFHTGALSMIVCCLIANELIIWSTFITLWMIGKSISGHWCVR